MITLFAMVALCLSPPVNGPIVNGYSPVGRYEGHWGVDFGAPLGTLVTAPTSGRVTFAGSVAGTKTVTIEPVPGFRVSISYLATIEVGVGERVRRGQVVATSGLDHGTAAVHLSTRNQGEYLDPEPQLGCGNAEISRALRLVTPPQPYPRRRANRHPRRNLRSDPHRPSPCRGVRHRSGPARSHPVHPRR